MTPAPAHGDGPTRPSAPTGRTERFEGHEGRECGEHRTTGHRAWCFDCSEWCSQAIPCRGCELPSIRQRAEEAERALAQARDAIADERRGRLAAEAAVRRVRALHQPTQGQGYDCDEDDTPGSYGDIAQVCTSCGTADEYGVRWPCPTIAALDTEQPKETP